jgi:hypothetical protein
LRKAANNILLYFIKATILIYIFYATLSNL